MNSHRHQFAEAEWPFAEPANTTAFTTARVLRNGFPVLLVTHDQDGDWQILCGTTNDANDCVIVCLGCAFERDKSIGQLADLPAGWHAWRNTVNDPWMRQVREPEEVEF